MSTKADRAGQGDASLARREAEDGLSARRSRTTTRGDADLPPGDGSLRRQPQVRTDAARRRTQALVAGAIVALASRAALAQESTEEQARQSFQRGVAAMQQGRYAAAIAELEFSYGLLPRCSTRFNLAVAFEQTRRYADSLDAFQRYEAECAEAMPAQNAAHLADALRRLRARVGTVTLRVTPASAVASVTVDRRARADWSGELALDPGAHSIEVRARDGQVVRRDLQVAEGSRDVVDLSLGVEARAAVRALALAPDPYGPAESARPEAPRRLRIESPIAHATVLVDGRDQGEVPAEPRVTTGRHAVEVRADGYHPARFAVTLTDGAVTRLAPRLEPDEARASQPFYTRWWFWTLLGAAAVGGAAALTWELTRPADNVVYTFQAVRLP